MTHGMKQEALLPDTEAIESGTLEMIPYRGKWLVRYKTLAGDTYKQVFPAKSSIVLEKDRDEAFDQFCKWREQLRADAAKMADQQKL